MDVDLFGRAVEAAAIGYYGEVRYGWRTWDDLPEDFRAPWRLKVDPIVRAVFGVIADHCDGLATEAANRAEALERTSANVRPHVRYLAQFAELQSLASELRESK